MTRIQMPHVFFHRIYVIIVLIVFFMPLSALAGEPFARIYLRTEAPYYAGQTIQVDIQVLAPNYFTKAPEFPVIAAPGIMDTAIPQRVVNFVEKVNGETYAGIQKSYQIILQQNGKLTIPSVHISFAFAAMPPVGQIATVTVPELVIDVVGLQSGPAKAGQPPAVVGAIEISQKFDRTLEGLHTGDIITRTVTLSSSTVPAMLLPPLTFDAPDGVRIYPHEAKLVDGRETRGDNNLRIEQVSYEFEKPGHYVLPSIQIQWFDPQRKETISSVAPEQKITVEKVVVSEGPTFTGKYFSLKGPMQDSLIRWGFLCFAGIIIALFCRYLSRRYGMILYAWIAARRIAGEQTEKAFFHRALKALNGDDMLKARTALAAWMIQFDIDLPEFRILCPENEALVHLFEDYDRALFSKNRDFAKAQVIAHNLGSELVKVRSFLLHRNKRVQDSSLVPLNPANDLARNIRIKKEIS